MNVLLLSNLVTFVALVYMFCYMEVLPFSTKRQMYLTIGAMSVIVGVNLFLFTIFPAVSLGQISLFAQTLPSLILCWTVSRHKNMRFWFVFCSIDVLGFMLQLILKGLTAVLSLSEGTGAILEILATILFVIAFCRYTGEFKDTDNESQVNWGILTLFVLALYGYSYFFILYPMPLIERPEYAPVMIGYGIVVLLSYVLIVRMIKGITTIYDLRQEELKMKMQLEPKNRELKEQENRLLLHQIQPHFIYNVLMTIRYLTKKDPQAAGDMIYDFSKYLRSNIESLLEKEYILWGDELEHINAYVRIEEIRFRDRLNVVYDIEDGEFYLPPLTVEPLVENAIKHGIAPRSGGGTVWIRGSVQGEYYQIVVEDDGVGFQADDPDKKNGIGLHYIRTQLQKMPGADMKIESVPGKGTKVTLLFREGRSGENESNRSG